MKKEFKVESCDAGVRIDKYLALKLENTSRTLISSMIDEGLVKVNNKLTKSSYKIEAEDVIFIKEIL